jgi:hypothetical protein
LCFPETLRLLQEKFIPHFNPDEAIADLIQRLLTKGEICTPCHRMLANRIKGLAGKIGTEETKKQLLAVSDMVNTTCGPDTGFTYDVNEETDDGFTYDVNEETDDGFTYDVNEETDDGFTYDVNEAKRPGSKGHSTVIETVPTATTKNAGKHCRIVRRCCVNNQWKQLHTATTV